jgi:hypothetical protein
LSSRNQTHQDRVVPTPILSEGVVSWCRWSTCSTTPSKRP